MFSSPKVRMHSWLASICQDYAETLAQVQEEIQQTAGKKPPGAEG